MEAGAALVRDVRTVGAAQLPLFATVDVPPQVAAWDEEIALLLAERDELSRRRRSAVRDVELPPRLSVSQLVQLRRDPAALARELRRPLPQEPVAIRRRGTRFHLWLEQRWGQQRLLDIEELPGSADDTAVPDTDLTALQDAFRKSPWWHRTPAELEVPFDLSLGPLVLRGRIDAVFTDSPDGLVDVIDWKTGAPPRAADANEQAARAVQLAAYRLAWHGLSGTPLDRIRAGFHYVGSGVTTAPVDLLGESELTALVLSVPTPGTG